MKHLLLVCLLSIGIAAQTNESVLYSFQGGPDGERPMAGLVADASGNLYGTTFLGGSSNLGTVFELSPDGQGGWTKNTLYSFAGGEDGQGPLGALVVDSQGNLYGTTAGSISCPPQCGSVFQVSHGQFTVLHTFTDGDDGAAPSGGLVIGPDGSLYGAADGAANNVFNLRDGTFTVIRKFVGDKFGGSPIGPLVAAPDGTIYGAAKSGGVYFAGVVYSLSLNSKGKWVEKVLHAFKGGTDGGNLSDGLTQDTLGNLYGIGSNVMIYQMFINAKGKWAKKIIFTTSPGHNDKPKQPSLPFVDQSGVLHATSKWGGGAGDVFTLTQTAGKWNWKVLFDFGSRGDGLDGRRPIGQPVMVGGIQYGVTEYGGGTGCSGNGCGTVFELTP